MCGKRPEQKTTAFLLKIDQINFVSHSVVPDQRWLQPLKLYSHHFFSWPMTENFWPMIYIPKRPLFTLVCIWATKDSQNVGLHPMRWRPMTRARAVPNTTRLESIRSAHTTTTLKNRVGSIVRFGSATAQNSRAEPYFAP